MSAAMGFFPRVGWLFGCFGLNSPLRQYFSLYIGPERVQNSCGEQAIGVRAIEVLLYFVGLRSAIGRAPDS